MTNTHTTDANPSIRLWADTIHCTQHLPLTEVPSFSLPVESYWSRSPGAVLTGTTQTMVTHPNDLGVIEEADFDDFHPSDSIMEEHSTFIPSAGELASTVIIPHQVRDKNSDTDLLRSKNTLRATASLDNLGDGLLADFGCSQDPHPGVNNPMVNVLAEGESISPSSDENSALGDGFQVGHLALMIFSNFIHTSLGTHTHTHTHTHKHTHTHTFSVLTAHPLSHTGRPSLLQSCLPNRVSPQTKR